MMLHQAADHAEVFFHVGPGMQQAAGSENHRREVGEFLREYPPAAVPSLPPRIGEIHVHLIDRSGRNVLDEGGPHIAADDANIMEMAFFQPPGRAAAFAEIEFDPQIIDVRIRCTGGDEKQTPAAAHVDFDGMIVAEKFGPIDHPAGIVQRLKPGTEVGRSNARHGSKGRSAECRERKANRGLDANRYSILRSRSIGTPIMLPLKTIRSPTKP